MDESDLAKFILTHDESIEDYIDRKIRQGIKVAIQEREDELLRNKLELERARHDSMTMDMPSFGTTAKEVRYREAQFKAEAMRSSNIRHQGINSDGLNFDGNWGPEDL